MALQQPSDVPRAVRFPVVEWTARYSIAAFHDIGTSKARATARIVSSVVSSRAPISLPPT